MDLFAPGSDIYSAGNSSINEYRTKSGTSMASPHVAGAAALLLSRFPTLTPPQVASELTTLTSKDVIADVAGVPNRLLYVGPIEHFPPAVDAGEDQIVAVNAPVALDGSRSKALDGSLVQRVWTQTSGPAVAKIMSLSLAKTQVTGLTQPGIYEFSHQVTDSEGGVGSDQVKVTANLAPIVDAGKGYTTKLSYLDLVGTASDPDGVLKNTKWTQIKGTAVSIWNPFNLTTRVTGIKRGVHVFQLLARDNLGVTTTATIRIKRVR